MLHVNTLWAPLERPRDLGLSNDGALGLALEGQSLSIEGLHTEEPDIDRRVFELPQCLETLPLQ